MIVFIISKYKSLIIIIRNSFSTYLLRTQAVLSVLIRLHSKKEVGQELIFLASIRLAHLTALE